LNHKEKRRVLYSLPATFFLEGNFLPPMLPKIHAGEGEGNFVDPVSVTRRWYGHEQRLLVFIHSFG
jgi:hypothetical protein